MDKRTIIFRADGGQTIGIGHFIRTLALAEMLNEHFHCIYATRKPTEYQITEIENVCHGRIDLPEDDSHFNEFLNHLKGDEIVVLDNYYYTTKYQKAIKAKGCKLVCIDDMHDKHYVADVVINHAEGLEPEVYSAENYTKLLLGYSYALLRKNFKKTINQTIKKEYACLVMMGGADPLNMTLLVMEQLAKIKFDKPVAVISGNSIESWKTKYAEQFVLFKNLTAHKVEELMRTTVFGIFSASTVAIEACAVRLPFICGYFVDNQKEIYAGIKKNNLAVCVGDLKEITNKRILSAVQEVNDPLNTETLIRNQIIKMDNQSEKRLLKNFQKL